MTEWRCQAFNSASIDGGSACITILNRVAVFAEVLLKACRTSSASNSFPKTATRSYAHFRGRRW